ncbi:hypothetical protein CH373_07200 [Leptospira perolatii]|uniref:LamG-like jellyroll fold domain-containing protein n=1 Tax=Leptospira perolatii TaxID=2023191 RepID=A0A2M9ZPC3_9LEPT|nr:LamG domain-containing protein [Leptospira perolatii]PJZ70708.1 hypothetical protein CH360_04060 [Leptospira perolatii]PJZ73917.1 hypothetical protein CH373_07200 [Leptospira perolatii]
MNRIKLKALLPLFLSLVFGNCGTIIILYDLLQVDSSKQNYLILASLLGNSTLSQGLLHHWPLDGNAQDSVGTLNLSAFGSGMTSVTGHDGVPSGAFHYHGTAFHSSSQNGEDFLAGNISSFTVSAWASGNFPAVPSGLNGIFLSQGNGFGLQYYNIGVCTGRLRGFTNDGSSGDVDVSSACGVYSNNTWYHIAFVWELPTKRATFYVNGSQITSGSGGLNYPWGTLASFQLATSSLNSGYIFDGAIDEVRIYNRALSSTEIQLLSLQ